MRKPTRIADITPEMIEAAYEEMQANLTDRPHVPHTPDSESPLSKETTPMVTTYDFHTNRAFLAAHGEEQRVLASEYRHGGRAITAKLAVRIEDFTRPDAYQTVLTADPRNPTKVTDVPVWIASLGMAHGFGIEADKERLQMVWSYHIDPAYGTKENGWGWTSIAQSKARGHDGNGQSVFLPSAEAMVSWPVYRAAFVASVFVYRHPDAELEFTTDGLVEVVDVDMGSSFNGQPHNADEREVARDMAVGLNERAKRLTGKAREAAQNVVYELEELGECPHDVVTDTEHRLGMLYGICAECDEDLVQTGEEDEMGVPGWEVVSE